MGFHIWQTKMMSIRDVLAENFKKLRDANPLLSTLPQLVSKGASSKGTLDRITRSEVNVGIDHLEPLAAVYGVEPWQLLHPDFDPATAPPTAPREPLRRYGHMAESIALLVDQIPESDAATKTRMLVAVSLIVQEWSEHHKSKTPSELNPKKLIKQPRVKT